MIEDNNTNEIGVGPAEDWGTEVEDDETTTPDTVDSLLNQVQVEDDSPPPRELNDKAVVSAIKEKIMSTPEGKAIKFPGKLHKPLMSAVASLRKTEEGRQFPTKAKYNGTGKDKVIEYTTVWT